MEGGAIVVGLVAFLVALAVGVLIGAVIFRAAVSLTNKFLGSTGAVPEPPFNRAVVIVLITTIVNMIGSFVAGVAAGAGAAAADAGESSAKIAAQLISLPIGFFIASGIYSAMLPTSFGKAMLVTVCQYIIIILIAIVMVVVVVGVMAMMGGR